MSINIRSVISEVTLPSSSKVIGWLGVIDISEKGKIEANSLNNFCNLAVSIQLCKWFKL